MEISPGLACNTYPGKSSTNHPKVAAILNNLALVLRDTNRFSEAELLLRRALAITEKSLGPENPEMAVRLGNLAQLLHATKRLVEAETLMKAI